jgi:Protein of unknown function (DUF2975)
MVRSPTMFDMASEQDSERRMNRIRHLSRLMATGCLATSWVLAAAMFLYWTTTPTRTLFSQAGIPNAPVTEIDFSVRALAFVVSMVPLGALIYGLLSARRCFNAFAAGQIFCREPIKRLKGFSIGIAASALLKPFAGAVLSVLLSFNNSAGAKALSLNIGSDTLIALIFAGTVAAIAWVMTEALEIADENKQFV